jgi:hypothetical protein
MTLHWIATALRTGEVLAEFPDLSATGLRRTIGQYESTTASFPVIDQRHAPPRNWLDATAPFKTMLVALNDDEQPVWGGIVLRRQRDGGKAVQLGIATPEVYATRRYIRQTLQYPQTDRLFIASDLINRFLLDGASGRNGVPLRVDIQSDGATADGDYKDSDDKQVYSALQSLGGEWTVGLERLPDTTRITQVWSLSERLGTPASADLGPAVTLDWPGNLASVQVIEDYSDGNGGNDVMATSSGQGSVRPQSAHQVVAQPERPVVEIRQSAGDNITRLATLNAYAANVLSARANGSTGYAVTISQAADEAFAFDLGDDLGISLSGDEFPDQPNGILRAAGIQYDQSTVTPIMAGVLDG